ncbi:hypothetical protein DFA_00477 [Cavenderia fasciculata]|uniref:Uncharacterized protein n=1 Tax=Cavenderia fasciculata TaxID=261658 RepID=F4PS18_CACFS|nr:uncharacterized protein DFA_00477 [Cavenderia fasciculata]EGG20616.1 hypothetical protein DFA_00477 [Cavenderia fasciculata]|eukprot:XP_004358466.1 hypothetical protein DFA_00477 [Cavenderia fasciculata]
MEEPNEEFIEMIVTLAKENQMKQQKNRDITIDTDNNNNSSRLKSVSKQQYKEYIIDKPDKVVSWLLYLIVKGTFTTIKDKAIQLLDRLLEREYKEVEEGEEDHDFINELSKSILDAVEFETEELINNYSKTTDLGHTHTFKAHLISIIESISNYRLGQPNDEDIDAFTDNLFLILKKSNTSVTGIRIEYAVQQLMQMYIENAWIGDIIGQSIDSMVDVLDRHSRDSENRFASTKTKRMIFAFLMVVSENDNNEFTDSHLERIVFHLYEWLGEVKDVSLEEWTESNRKIDIDNNFFKFPYDGEQEEQDALHDSLIQEQEEEEHDEDSEVTSTPVYSLFGKFAHLFSQRISGHIFNQFNILSTSQQWKDRYAAMISLSKCTNHIPSRIRQQFSTILKLVLKCTDDENIRVRWASFQFLIQLTVDFNELIIESSGKIFKVIRKSICDPNQRIQNCCCMLIHTMMELLNNDDNIVEDSILDGLFNSIEILLQSPKLYVVESAFVSLMSVIQKVCHEFIPYYPRFIPIIFKLLERHNGTKESRLLRSRAIKAFAICCAVVEEKIFLKDFHKFMQFVKKNEKSFDLTVQVVRTSDLLMKTFGKSFEIYLPMIVKMVIKILEAPLPNQVDDITLSSPQEITKIMSTLKILSNRMSLATDGTVYDPLAPFVHSLVDPLCKLTVNPLIAKIRIQSLACLPACLQLFKLQYGERSDKTREMFGHIYEIGLCHQETDLRVAVIRITLSTFLINAMGKDAMTFEQVQSTLDAFNRMEKWIEDIVNGDIDIAEDDDQDLIDTAGYTLVTIYGMISIMVEHNGSVMTQLITPTFLNKICDKLRDNGEDDIIKVVLLNFLAKYCKYGGEGVINTFPLIIKPIIECLELQSISVKRTASLALGEAAQLAKDRFSPWVIDTLHFLHAIVSSPNAYTTPDNKENMEQIVAILGRVIRYVPHTPASNLVIIIPQWLGHPPIEDKDQRPITISNLCAIVRIYPNECIGKDQQYKHVERLHQLIVGYMNMDTCQPEEKQQLYQTWDYIKEDILKENWNSIPLETRDKISNLNVLEPDT